MNELKIKLIELQPKHLTPVQGNKKKWLKSIKYQLTLWRPTAQIVKLWQAKEARVQFSSVAAPVVVTANLQDRGASVTG